MTRARSEAAKTGDEPVWVAREECCGCVVAVDLADPPDFPPTWPVVERMSLDEARAALSPAHAVPACRWAARVEELSARIGRVRALHSEHRLYDPCDHEHTDDDLAAGRAVDTGDGLTCEDSYFHSVCKTCCCDDGEQTATCADTHHVCWPCPTIRALDGES